jgi:hypothetical protein
MNDAELVAVDQCVENRRDDLACLRLIKSLSLQDLVEKLNGEQR